MGPLFGMKILELAGIGPSPLAAMLLADLGATVVRIDRPAESGLGIERPPKYNFSLRNRKSIALDLKSEAGRDLVLRLVEEADGLIEGFRPGVMEKLSLGPDICLARNPRLVYGRMTGWGQEGPLAKSAGHDLNYIAVTGVLDMIGRDGQPPTPPLNLVGDFGGGALYLAFGMLAAFIESKQSGNGQVVDAAIVDGVLSLALPLLGLHAAGQWNDSRGNNILDSGAYFYEVYKCADEKWISVAAIEKKFHDLLLQMLGLDASQYGDRFDRQNWNERKRLLADRFMTKTRDEWCTLFGDADVCVAPVLAIAEVAHHPHMKSREAFVEIDGIPQPAPAPRFSRSRPDRPVAPSIDKESLETALSEWLAEDEIKLWKQNLTMPV
ncbi:CaiB/BaiF CoA transferase family protein [Noviherbaspirillum malthae]|uniref:CaiB/BaiF CoA transferase family protein n=1 Tax=Noviherbaspirillum malthae TaxID=1260987 RepID=UPI00188F46D1|nr:CaiB/BaiF CoA-transferase family protein [Noviherbaspirillum malthae]